MTQEEKTYLKKLREAGYSRQEIICSLVSDILGKSCSITETEDYLRTLQEKIPVINAYGYMDSQSVFHSKTDLEEYQNLLQEYEYLQYNNIFDNDKIDELFQVNDE